jgi:hypothetical protein
VSAAAGLLLGAVTIAGAAGSALLAVDVGTSIGTGDYDTLAFDVGLVLGGGVAGRALPGTVSELQETASSLASDESGAAGGGGAARAGQNGVEGSRFMAAIRFKQC